MSDDLMLSRRVSRREALRLGALAVGAATLAGIGIDAPPAAHAQSLDRVTVQGGRIADSSGRSVVLRGLVSITSPNGLITPPYPVRPIGMTSEDYRRFRQWGFNAQVIRLDGGRLGIDASCVFDPAYLDMVDNWTTLAAAEGIYTCYKMTLYSVPSWYNRTWEAARWQEFWDNTGGQIDSLITAWERLWQRFAGRPEVLGYDVLNEPHEGTIPATQDVSLVHNHLTPLYNQAAARLRQADPEAMVLFQPVMDWTMPEPLNDPNSLFVPHLYPKQIGQFETWANYMVQLGNASGTAMAVPEFGWPDTPVLGYPAWTAESERAYASAFDSRGLGSWRVWYTYDGTWNVLDHTFNEHVEKMNILSRPYPQRLAGTPDANRWTYNHDTKAFSLDVQPLPSVAASNEIFVPVARHYPDGFRLDVNGAILHSDPSRPSGMRLISGSASAGFDFQREILSIPASAQTLSIALTSEAMPPDAPSVGGLAEFPKGGGSPGGWKTAGALGAAAAIAAGIWTRTRDLV